MDKRFFLALVLTAIVIVATPLLFPGANRRPAAPAIADSTRRGPATDTSLATPVAQRPVAPTTPSVAAPSNSSVSAPIAAVETTTVRTARATYVLSSRGAAPVSVVLDSYPSRRPGTTGRPVDLVRPRAPLMHYSLALGRDTIALDTVPLRVEKHDVAGAPVVSYDGNVAGHAVQVAYTFVPDSFLVRVSGSVAGAPAGSALLVDLPRTLASNEPDTLDDMGHLAVSYRDSHGDVTSVPFGKLDSTRTRIEAGPIRWVAARNKYFLVAYRTPEKTGF